MLGAAMNDAGNKDQAMLREINFDGIVGPSHNYAGLSLGNLACLLYTSPSPRDRG